MKTRPSLWVSSRHPLFVCLSSVCFVCFVKHINFCFENFSTATIFNLSTKYFRVSTRIINEGKRMSLSCFAFVAVVVVVIAILGPFVRIWSLFPSHKRNGRGRHTHAHSQKRENIYSANALIYYINMKLCFAIHQAHFDEEEEKRHWAHFNKKLWFILILCSLCYRNETCQY